MKWAPQGLDRVTRLEGAHRRPAAGRYRRHHAGAGRRRLAAGADSVAVITDFFTHPDPEARVRQWLAWAERVQG